MKKSKKLILFTFAFVFIFSGCEKNDEIAPDFGNSIKTKTGINDKLSGEVIEVDEYPLEDNRLFVNENDVFDNHIVGCMFIAGGCMATVDINGLTDPSQEVLTDLVAVISFGIPEDIITEFSDNQSELNPIIGETLVSGVINGSHLVDQVETDSRSILLFTDASSGAEVNQIPLNW